MNNLSGFRSNQILKAFAAIAVILFFLSVSELKAQLDSTFGTNGVAIADTGGDDAPLASFVLPDGKILIVDQAWFNSFRRHYFAKFNSDGTPDTTYGTNGQIQVTVPYSAPLDGEISAAVRQSDGKIVLAGNDNFQRGIVVRYNENGTLDTGFASGGVHRPDIALGLADGIESMVVQPDGKILVAGVARTTSCCTPRMFLLRYLSNGSLDDTFGNGVGFIVHESILLPNSVGAEYIFLQSTGKIIVGSRYEGAPINNTSIRRFNADGTIDGGFSIISVANNNFKTPFVQPDDKILVGSTVSKNETLERVHTDSAISRYNSDGSVDAGFGTGGQTSFDVTNYFDDSPKGFQVLGDGQILVGIDTIAQPNRNTLFRGSTLAYARLSPSGAVNGKFLAFKSQAVYPEWKQRILMSVLPDGKILTAYSTRNAAANNGDILLTRITGVPLQTYKLQGVPFDFALPSNGQAKPSLFRPSDRKWYIYPNASGFFFGLADDIPVPSDYIKDFATEMAVFRPSDGTWYIARDYNNAATNYISIRWGLSGDIPAPADYDGDGKSDLAVFRPSNGVWYIRNSSNDSFTIFQWGLNGDKPVSGDYDGDGKYDVGVFRPSDGNWYILRSSDGQPYILHFGLNGDIPVHEDYDGDGKFDIAVYRPSDGIWYRLNSSDGSFFAMAWAIPADIPTPADYDGDLKADITVWRPSQGRWYINQSTTNSMLVYTWGTMGDVPLEGK
jgi:uncharacterized delta-60 repeat protein